MSCDFGLVHHLWDSGDEPGTMLDRVLGEARLDHLTVPVVTGPTEQFRLNPAHPPHTFVTEGGWHFPPDPDCYTSGSVRPRAARWTGKRDGLAKLRDHAGNRSVKLVFRVDLRAVTSLPEHEPHLRPRNAWGDENAAAGVCVLNADVRELLRGALADLARYEPAGFQLVDWMVDVAIDRGPTRQFSESPLLRQLLDVCFCAACRQTATVAGVDPDQAARSVRVHIERLIADPEGYKVADKLIEDSPLRAYFDVRRRDALTWLERLAESYGQRQWSLLADAQSDHRIAPAGGSVEVSSGTFVRMFRPVKPLRDIRLEEDFRDPQTGQQPESFGLVLPLWYPFVRQAGELVRVVSAATQAGITPIDFEGLEAAPVEAVDRLRQAVRFARRG
jgi:hypothetical protein